MNDKNYPTSNNQTGYHQTSTPISMNKSFQILFENCILMEYKYVQKFCPLGIYILPDAKNLKIWNGVIYLKDGLYQKGIFKFILQISNVYPSEIPQIFFVSKIIHPLVDKETGKLDLQKKFVNWKPGKNLIVHILFHLKNIFYNPVYLQEKDSFNPGCSKMFAEDHTKFKEEIKKLCESSFEERYGQTINEEVKNIDYNTNKLNFTPSNTMNQLFLDKISQQNKNENLPMSEKLKELKKWFLESYVEIVKENK